MAYLKHTWAPYEVIAAANLNHMEDGIEAAAEKANVLSMADILAASDLTGKIASAEAAKGLATLLPNPNLFMNGWFQINQRGVTSGSTYGYMLDEWIFDFGTASTWSYADGVVTLAPDGRLMQKFERGLNGKTVTFSYTDSSNGIHSGTAFINGAEIDLLNNGTIQARWIPDSNRLYIYNRASSPVSIKPVKLEFGSVSTLANDVAPDYATELLKCNNKLWIVKTIETTMCNYTGNIGWTPFIPFPVKMRSVPAITITNFRYWSGNSWQSIADGNASANVTADGFNVKTSYLSGFSSGASLIVRFDVMASAEL